MERQFWIDSWREGGSKTSFHLPAVHPHARHLLDGGFVDGARVLVPLCGKSADMPAFATRAAEVVGVELVDSAVHQFFADNGLEPEEPAPGVFRSGNLTLLHADFFRLTTADLGGPVDLVYDRACLVAFPEDMRERYVAHLTALLDPGARYFLNTLDYLPELPEPPFSVCPDRVRGYFGGHFEIEHVFDEPRPEHRMVEKFGLSRLTEHGFLLRRTATPMSVPPVPSPAAEPAAP
ncbi:hypothetical protein [Streptomyces sp. NPDC097619]|uniref:hypothetical protein n=1 Tax=Streptomyces sp. NPDC097619 TaxID=3157228 RepID=UPI0033288F13